jgi:uncharacterized protein (DUF1501 family)
MKRRSFIKTTAAATPIVIGGLTLRANTSLAMLAQMPAQENDRILIIIQMFGGNDGLNTMIPALDDEYYKLRPSIAVRKEEAWNNIGDIFLHPALTQGTQGGVARMLELGTLAIVQGVGYDNPNLSHFRSTDIWLSGINDSSPNARLDTGWVGRYLEERYPDFPASLPDHPLAVQFGGSFSLTLLSGKGRMGIEVTDPENQLGVSTQLDTLDGTSSGTHYEQEYAYIADIAARSNKYAQAVRQAYMAGKPLIRGEYSGPLGPQMAAVGAMIAGGLKSKVYVVSIGGFDTHVTQQLPGNVGQHPELLSSVSNSIAQLMADMTERGHASRIVGMTVSEFGRRPHENGSRGTDHGAASVQFVFGPQVNSGVFGNAPDLKNLDSNGDLNYQIDYRKIYAEILTDWFGMTLEEMRAILRDDTLLPIDVIKGGLNSVDDRTAETAGTAIMDAYPDPFISSATINIRLERPGHTRLELVTPTGQQVLLLCDRWLQAGTHHIPLTGSVASGTYLCVLQSGDMRVARSIRCVR